MATRRFHGFLWVLVLSSAFGLPSSAAERRPVSETDLFRFVWIADPQISPDGSQVAFVRVNVDAKQERYETSVWLTRTDAASAPRRLSGSTRDTTPRWSPDGRRIAFVRAAEQDGRVEPPQIYVMAMDGGDARAVTNVPRGAARPVWSPDGTTIAFSATARSSEVPGEAATPPEQRLRESDVRVISDASYRANGEPGLGFRDLDRPAHIWTVSVPAAADAIAAPKQITSGDFAETDVRWSPDGSRLFFVSDRRKETYYFPEDSDIYAVSRSGGSPERIVSIAGSIGAFEISRDGRRLAFVGRLHGDPELSFSQPDLWVVDLAGGPPRNLTSAYDFDVNATLAGDQRAPRGQQPAGPVWSGDGRSVFIRVGEHGSANLKRVDVETGRVDPITTGNHEVVSYSADEKGRRFAVLLSTQTLVGDLHVLDEGAKSPKRLTSFNQTLFDELTLSEPEEMWYTSFDGKRIQAWILKPPAFNPNSKYPLILQIHGGPHSAYGNTFTHEFQWMTAKGYVVLFTNPFGSSNYGQEFGNIIQFKYPGDDYRDLMAGVDEILKKGYVDEARMGVTGGSGGGLLTNWVVTHTTRFKAAVAQRDIADWSNWWYTSDLTLFTPTWFRKAPFEDPADFAQRSPITHVANVRTPMMFILGDADWRTPTSAGGEEMFRALKYLKRPAVMVRFPRENHELSRAGEPWHRVERLQHIVGWMDRWVLGKEQ